MIEYKTGVQNIDWQKLFDLYRRVRLLRRFIENEEYSKIQIGFERSYKVVTAWDGDILIGACRMLSDGVCYASVFDVGVLPEYQRMGIGRGMIETLLGGEEPMPVHLTSTFGNEGFYRRLGFKRHKTAYAKYPYKTMYVD